MGLTYVLDEELISSKWYDFKISILENDQVHIIVLPDGEAQIDYDFTLDYYDEESRYYVFSNQGENTFKIKFVINSINCEVFVKLGSVELGNTHLNEGATFAQYFALTNITTTLIAKKWLWALKSYLLLQQYQVMQHIKVLQEVVLIQKLLILKMMKAIMLLLN